MGYEDDGVLSSWCPAVVSCTYQQKPKHALYSMYVTVDSCRFVFGSVSASRVLCKNNYAQLSAICSKGQDTDTASLLLIIRPRKILFS